MKFENFEDMIIWQRSRELNVKLYKEFDELKDFNFKNQILRASVSVMNNIAEGYERKTNNEFKHFLYMSKGSAGELRSMLYLGKDLSYLTEEKFNEYYNEALSLTKMISSLIKKL